jgi:hypothetical protein
MPKITEGRFALGGLTFIAVWLLVVLPLLYRPAQYAPQVHAEQQTRSTLKSEENAKGSPPRSAQANEENGGKHPEQSENEGTEFWPSFFGVRLKITDSLLAGFTFGLLIFTGLLWRSTDKLWTAGERQLKLAAETSAAQSRDMKASIAAAVTSANNATVANRIASTTAEHQLRAYFTIELTKTVVEVGVIPKAEILLRNVGATPAYDLTIAATGEFGSFPLFAALAVPVREEILSQSILNPRSELVFSADGLTIMSRGDGE